MDQPQTQNKPDVQVNPGQESLANLANVGRGRAPLELSSKVSNALQVAPNPNYRWSPISALSSLTGQAGLSRQAEAQRSALPDTKIRILRDRPESSKGPSKAIEERASEVRREQQKASAIREKRMQKAQQKQQNKQKAKEQQRIAQANDITEMQELTELNRKQKTTEPLDFGLNPYAATDSVDNRLQNARTLSLRDLTKALNKVSAIDTSLKWGGTIQNASQRSHVQTALEDSKGLGVIKKELDKKGQAAVLSNSSLASKDKEAKEKAVAATIGSKARTQSLTNKDVARRILDVATMQDMLGGKLKTSIDDSLEEFIGKASAQDIAKIKSVNNAKEYELAEVMSFRQGITKANIRRKVELYNALSLMSHMVAHWIITRESMEKIRQEMLKEGIEELPLSLLGGDFFEEYVKMFEAANIIIDGESFEEAVNRVKNDVDPRSFMERMKAIFDQFEAEFRSLVGFSFES